MPGIGSQHEPATSSSRLDHLVAEMSARVEAGQPIDLNTLAADSPEYREQLEMLLPTLEAVVDLEHSLGVSDSETSSPLAHNGPLQGILGDFRIIREIGRGGMGVVYEAEQLSLGRRLALKVLPLAATLSSEQLQRFKNEARAAASLKHPNIVGVYSVGVERGVHFYAMELIEGRSLAEAITEMRNTENRAEPLAEKGSGSVPETIKDTPLIAGAALSTVWATNSQDYYRQSARLIAVAAEAMEYAHGQGVIHRDIKPANLLIDQHSHVSVTDFGLARLEADAGVTLTGDILGTLRYMSPEQAAGKPGQVDYRTDIHALGATLYELLTLRPPFDCKDRAGLLRSVAENEPIPLRKIDLRIPEDLETVTLKALEKEPDDRYASARELAADLRAFAEHRPITARPPSLYNRAQKWAQRHKAVVAAGFTALLLASIGLAVGAVLVGHQRNLAIRNADNAEANFQLAISALEETLSEITVGDLAGSRLRMSDDHKELMRRGIRFYEQVAAQNGVDPNEWPTYRFLLRTNALERAHELDDQKQYDMADVAYKSAILLAEQMVADDNAPKSLSLLDARESLANAYNSYATFLLETDKFQLAARFLLQARDIIEDHRRRLPEVEKFAYQLGMNHYNMGVICAAVEGGADDEEASYRQALPLMELASSAEPGNIKYRHVLAMCQYNLALRVVSTERKGEAEAFWNQSLEQWRKLLKEQPQVSEFHSRTGATLSNLGVLAKQRGALEAARELLEQALAHQKRAIALEPENEIAAEFLEKHYSGLIEVAVEDSTPTEINGAANQ